MAHISAFSSSERDQAAGPAAPGSFARPDDLLQPTMRNLAALALTAAYVWSLAVITAHNPTPYWPGLAAPVLLAAAATLSLRQGRRYRVAALLLGAGVLLAAVVETAAGHHLTGQWLAVAAVLVAGVLLGPRYAAAAAALMAAAALALPLPPQQRWWLISQVAFVAVIAWVAGTDIVRALRRAEESESAAWRYAAESAKRRADLQATSKALHDMYALLEKTNRELELARREAEEAREVKARFAANISHELRTPLNLILGFSQLMCRSPEVYGPFAWPGSLRADILEIYRASRHLLGMIDDILDLSRIEAQRLPLRIEPTDMRALIEDAANTVRGLMRHSQVQIRTAVPDDLPPLLADETRIRQVLLNLLTNAMRFTDSGGIEVTARLRDGEVEVSVTDTGVGILEADLPTIFDEFSQAGGPITSGRGGAGLGLAVCKQFVQMHGGRIGVTSRLGEGSTFTFTVPLPDTGRARSRLAYYSPPGWQPPLPRDQFGPSVVVLAPDERSARLVARGLDGYRAVPVDGIEALRTAVESEHPVGVILVRDLLAPDEGPGVEEVWRATGRDDVGVVECELAIENVAKTELQVDAYVPKPVQPEQILSVVRRCGGQAERILVVDDDPGFRALLQRVLSAAFPQAAVRLCSGGDEALALLAGDRFGLLFLDLAMPRVDGTEFLRRARQAGLLEGVHHRRPLHRRAVPLAAHPRPLQPQDAAAGLAVAALPDGAAQRGAAGLLPASSMLTVASRSPTTIGFLR